MFGVLRRSFSFWIKVCSVLILVYSFLLFPIGLYGQAPTPSKASNEPKPQTASSQKETAQDQRGTEKSPPVIKVAPTPKTDAESKLEKEDRDEKATNEGRLVWFTGALVIVAILQLFAFIVQALRLGQTIGVMRDTAARQLRAYVSITASGRELHLRPTLAFRVAFKNCGQTPAYDLKNWMGVKLKELPLTSILEPPPEGFVKSKTMLGPGADSFIRKVWRSLTAEELQDIHRGTHAVYVFGRIEYRDAFDVQQFTNFRLLWRDDDTVESLQRHESGNDGS